MTSYASAEGAELPPLEDMLRHALTSFTKEMAELTARRVRLGLYTQKYPHAPLSPRYALWKAQQGLDPRILIATEKYVLSIRARKVGKDQWHVGPAPRFERRGLMLEYGTRRMPARPHYRPEIRRLQLELRKQGQLRVQQVAKRWVEVPISSRLARR